MNVLITQFDDFMYRTLMGLMLVGILAGCDSSENGSFPLPPGDPRDLPLSLESPSAGDTLRVGVPFMIKGELKDDAEYVQVMIVSGAEYKYFYWYDRIENPGGSHPYPFELNGIIRTGGTSDEPQRVELRFVYREGRYVGRPLYVK